MLVGMLAVSLAACQGTKTTDTPAPDAPTTTEQEGDMGNEDIAMGESILQWGSIVSIDQDANQIEMQLNDADSSMKLILNTTKDTPVIDSASGENLPMDVLKEGSEIYAWVSPAFMTSQPPQTAANILIANIEQGTVPNYQTVASVEKQDEGFVITTTDGIKWNFEEGTSLKAYPSYEDVSIETLKQGNKCLFWPQQIAAQAQDNLILQPEKILIME